MLILLIVQGYLDLGFLGENWLESVAFFGLLLAFFYMGLALNYKYFVDYVIVVVPFTWRI